MTFLRRSSQLSNRNGEPHRPTRIPPPLETRDIRALVVAHAIVEQSDADVIDVAGAEPGNHTTPSIPAEVTAWARNLLGADEEVCTCSIHCRPS